MKFYPSRSIRQLVVLGFAVVALPLFVALGATSFQVQRLNAESQNAVYNSARVIQLSRVILEHATALERTGKHYLILSKPELLANYREQRQGLHQVITELRASDVGAGLREVLDALDQDERAGYQLLQEAKSSGKAGADDAENAFPPLARRARELLGLSSELIRRDTKRLRAAADDTQDLLAVQAFTLIPAAVALIALFVAFITRPLRRLDSAIRALGAGEFEVPIQVKGPRDLVELGERLEWLRARLAELEGQKVTFLRHISHELKTPLSTISIGADLLRQQRIGEMNARQREAAELIRRNASELQRLIDELLNFSISQPERPFVERRPVSLKHIVEEVVSDYQLQCRAKNLSIRSELRGATVVGDQDELKTIVDNLLSNAMKYGPPGSEIQVRLERAAGFAVLAVADAGPGVPMEDRGKIFSPFYQGSAHHDGQIRGTGIGLSIVKEYLENHNGTIEILDSAQGAHFRVRIPLAA